jgi:hypothetical protein
MTGLCAREPPLNCGGDPRKRHSDGQTVLDKLLVVVDEVIEQLVLCSQSGPFQWHTQQRSNPLTNGCQSFPNTDPGLPGETGVSRG